jgi:hypothetical protein
VSHHIWLVSEYAVTWKREPLPHTSRVEQGRLARPGPQRGMTALSAEQLQRTVGNRALSAVLEQRVPSSARPNVVQRVTANRVEYQHNPKVTLDGKGNVTLKAPIDISFGSEEHSEYFARERSEDQLVGLKTYRWRMDDDWWKAAWYHSYKGKKPTGRATNWLERINKAHCRQMAPSDGHSLTTDTKKKAPHFDANWDEILNDAVERGSGHVEDTESEKRAEKKERREKEEEKRTAKTRERVREFGGTVLGTACDPVTHEEYPGWSKEDADAVGWTWKPD